MDLIPKPHQAKAVDDLMAAIDQGAHRVILTSPTGGGKSYTIALAIRRLTGLGKRSQLYTNRKFLVEQTEKKLVEYGIDFGTRAAGYEFQPYYPVQLSSVQTEYQRVVKEKENRWMLFDSDVVFIDEGHMANNPQCQSLVNMHLAKGAVVVYVTATPLDMEGMAEHMIVAGTNSELRACGMLVPALHYGAPEPDFRRFKIEVGHELTEPQVKKALNVKKIFGNIVEWYDRTNPDRKPAVLFAPGVEESRWLASHLASAGISAAHIDGEDVWVDGEFHKSSTKVRDNVLERSRDGSIKVLCNRFVLREGVDAPWLAHGIFATTFGSIQTYLQSGGRLLRSDGVLPYVTIQDHGGNWWRWGSLNADRTWELDVTARMVQGDREEKLRDKKEREPCRCPKCGLILAGRKCTCGYTVDEFRKMRPIVQEDGSVMEHVGDIFIQRIRRFHKDTTKLWSECYYRGASTTWILESDELVGASKRAHATSKSKNTDPTHVSGRMLNKIAGMIGCTEELKSPFHALKAAAFLRDAGHKLTMAKPGLTFSQVEVVFLKDYGYYPPRDLGLMPVSGYDWYRRVIDVPYHRLHAGQQRG